MSGYIKLHRKCLDSAVFGDSDLWRFWCWCLLRASYKSRQVFMNGVVVDIEPGQFIMGRKSASEELRLSQQSIRTMLKNLEKLGNLTSQSTNRFTVVTLINWEVYQDDAEISTSQSTSNQPAANQQLTSNQPAANHKQEGKEGYNVRKEEDKYIVHPDGMNDNDLDQCRDLVEVSNDPGQLPGGLLRPSGCRLPMQQIRAQAELFLAWYERYPRKSGRKPAWEKWLRIRPLLTADDLPRLLSVLDMQCQSEQWQESSRLIPLPETYISKQRWDEQLVELPETRYGYGGDW